MLTLFLSPFISQGDYSLTKTSQYITQAGLEDFFSATEPPLTFFLPSDTAWAAVDPTLMDALEQDQNRLQRVLLYGTAAQSVGTLYTAGEVVALCGNTSCICMGICECVGGWAGTLCTSGEIVVYMLEYVVFVCVCVCVDNV